MKQYNWMVTLEKLHEFLEAPFDSYEESFAEAVPLIEDAVEVITKKASLIDSLTTYASKLEAENKKLKAALESSKQNSIEWRSLYYEAMDDLNIQRQATVRESGLRVDAEERIEDYKHIATKLAESVNGLMGLVAEER